MEKSTLLSYVGSMQQLVSVRPVIFQDGRLSGAHGFLVKNGFTSFTVVTDKCMDIGELQYKGINFSFLAKPGLNGRNQFDTHGKEALRSIIGGLFFTCGTENICASFTDSKSEKDYPMHGRLRTTPAEHICSDSFWTDDRYTIRLSGEMREAELFGENMQLRRTITTELNSKYITVQDVVTNESFRPEPLLYMYHINFGFPLVSPDAQIILPVNDTIPRDDISREGLANWEIMPEPLPEAPEQVFIHDLECDQGGHTFAAIYNPSLEVGIEIDFCKHSFPNFMMWKSIASGDYVIGFEPSNTSVYGRQYQEEHGGLHVLGSQKSEEFLLRFRILDGDSDLQEILRKQSALIH